LLVRESDRARREGTGEERSAVVMVSRRYEHPMDHFWEMAFALVRGWAAQRALEAEERKAVTRTFRGRVRLASRRDLRDVLAIVQSRPGVTASELRALALGRRAVAVDGAVRELVERGRIGREKGPRGTWQHFATRPGACRRSP
jgi:hypothetical protein